LSEPSEFDKIIADAIIKKRKVEGDLTNVISAASQSSFELGKKTEQMEFIEMLDRFNGTLAKSEEDARMTVEIIKQIAKRRLENSSL
jgi:hypothetical protein